MLKGLCSFKLSFVLFSFPEGFTSWLKGEFSHSRKLCRSCFAALVTPSAHMTVVGHHRIVRGLMNCWMLRMSMYVLFSVVLGCSALIASKRLLPSVTCNCSRRQDFMSLVGMSPLKSSLRTKLAK